MHEHLDVKTTNLLLDVQNPRLAEGSQSQIAAIQAMLRVEGPKTLALARSIAHEGLSPIDRMIVMPSMDDPGRYVSLEGNRRLTALRILREPSLAEGVVPTPRMRQLRKWSQMFRERRDCRKVACAVFPTREEANPWIERRHRGDQGGVGVVRWGGIESGRFDARRSGTIAPELAAFDFVSTYATLDAGTRERLRDISITNLRRILRDRKARETLGLEISSEGELMTRFPPEETLKGLTRIVRDLARKEKPLPVSEIYKSADRAKYLSRFTSDELPDESRRLERAVPLLSPSATPAIAVTRGGDATVRTPTPTPRKRAKLIPGDCTCEVDVPKLKGIYIELRRLDVEEFTNSVSVLFRVFLELSIDTLLERSNPPVMTLTQIEHSILAHKLTKAADHLESVGALTGQQARAAKTVASGQHVIGGNIKTMHDYVHNPHLAASPSDLRVAWDNLQPLMQAVWPRTAP